MTSRLNLAMAANCRAGLPRLKYLRTYLYSNTIQAISYTHSCVLPRRTPLSHILYLLHDSLALGLPPSTTRDAAYRLPSRVYFTLHTYHRHCHLHYSTAYTP